MNTDTKRKISVFTDQELDVQKLEERLEMASALPNSDDWSTPQPKSPPAKPAPTATP